MNIPFTPLTDDELNELDEILLYEVDTEEAMSIDMMDGFLYAIAIGPTTLQPRLWLPKIWGSEAIVPPLKSIDQVNHVMGLVMRHLNSIIAGLEAEPCDVSPVWSTFTYRGRDYEDAEGWAHGFVEGMKLCWADWQPMLDTPEGQAWFRPIGLLGEDEFRSDQGELTKTPARREKLALQLPKVVLAMHAFWLPLRHAVYQRTVAKAMQGKIGRNDPCRCGSGKKFKKCCGAAVDLH